MLKLKHHCKSHKNSWYNSLSSRASMENHKKIVSPRQAGITPLYGSSLKKYWRAHIFVSYIVQLKWGSVSIKWSVTFDCWKGPKQGQPYHHNFLFWEWNTYLQFWYRALDIRFKFHQQSRNWALLSDVLMMMSCSFSFWIFQRSDKKSRKYHVMNLLDWLNLR